MTAEDTDLVVNSLAFCAVVLRYSIVRVNSSVVVAGVCVDRDAVTAGARVDSDDNCTGVCTGVDTGAGVVNAAGVFVFETGVDGGSNVDSVETDNITGDLAVLWWRKESDVDSAETDNFTGDLVVL
jgi:hypothetical protein